MADRHQPAAREALNRFGMLAVLALLPSVVTFGWRAMLIIAGVLTSYAIARAVLREPHALRSSSWNLPTDAMLLAALMPAESATGGLWPLVPMAGVMLALFKRVRCTLPDLPFDAAVITALTLHLAAFTAGAALVPSAVLDRNAIVTGDVARARDLNNLYAQPWYAQPPSDTTAGPAQRVVWAASALDDYLRDRLGSNPNVSTNLDALIRDRLPPLEDLVLIGHPMPLGQASGVFLIAIVLWGAHRRVLDWRVPIVAGVFAYAALILLAIPTSFSSLGGNWRFFAAARADIGPATALTFAHYLIFASPIPIVLGLFAARLDAKPLRAGAMIAWAAVLGVVSAAATLYISVPLGALIAFAVAPMAARGFDQFIARRPMRLPQ